MDIDYLLFLQNLREATGGFLDGAFELITKLGEASIATLLVALIYWCVNKREGIFLMLTFYYNRVINAFIKITACVYRPWIRDPRVTPVEAALEDATGYSFPSGHSANATSVFGGLALNRKYHKAFRIGMIALILLVAFSRNYLGVHTPQDVIVCACRCAAVCVPRVIKLGRQTSGKGLDRTAGGNCHMHFIGILCFFKILPG